MVHFTCDLCGKDLTLTGDPRFVVKVEAYPSFDADRICPDDLDQDPMEAVSELLRQDEGFSSEVLAGQGPKAFRFDLCPCCHAKFIKDPLGRESIRSFNFSNN